VAYYAPVLNKNISPLQPVLRSNLWLTFHVLTITSSYAAGVLAWALANIALAGYLFGRYRELVLATEISEKNTSGATTGSSSSAAGITVGSSSSAAGITVGLSSSATTIIAGQAASGTTSLAPTAATADLAVPRRLAPEFCEMLGSFLYKVIQVAVLLLAAGTILGGLWADVSWGRFWGWDSKEVWALVSLLIYLAVLHGRYTGWFGNFGLSVGAVVGACSILMAWYGVNFVLGSGLHTYGEGVGGVQWALLIVAANWTFAILAALRYRLETWAPEQSP
jgi:ABC-type transport system involved in cytochrome c biogenesis permease subunit